MATVYISPTGSDARTYAQAQSILTPWQTIDKCNTSATSGDTIVVTAGTYTWVTQAFTNNFTIQGATNDPSLYIFDAGTVSGNFFWEIAATNTVTIKNLTFYRGFAANYLFRLGLSGTTNCNFAFENCIFKGNKSTSGAGRTMFYAYTTGEYSFSRCAIVSPYYDTAAAGNSVLHLLGAAVVNFNNCSICLTDTSTSPQSIFRSQGGTAAVRNVKNSIIYNGSGLTVTHTSELTGSPITITTTYSDWYLITTSPSGTGVITSDPLFLDAANGNFNLRPTSPCINSGTLV